jgi:hypothetical protein
MILERPVVLVALFLLLLVSLLGAVVFQQDGGPDR